MTVKTTWLLPLAVLTLVPGCSGSDTDDLASCPSEGSGMLQVEIESPEDVVPNVVPFDESGRPQEGLESSRTLSLPSGSYTLQARRVRSAGTLVGPAYQGVLEGADEASRICVRAGETARVTVRYQREPGSARLWLTQSNGDDAQVLSFDEAQLRTLGDQTPSVSLSPRLENAGAIRVDGKGRLWIGSTAGKLVAYEASRLGESSNGAPDVVLEGPALCENVVPCGVNAIAFDSDGALWAATLSRIVKLDPQSLEASGRPEAALTIASPDLAPAALAFDRSGDLWVADRAGAILRFSAARLERDIDAAADSELHLMKPGPVQLGLGSPEGLAFDSDGNLWIGYFAGNELARVSPAELARGASLSAPLVPSRYIALGAETLLTDLAIDEAGNLWLPGAQGALYRIDAADLSTPTPMVQVLRSAEIGSIERLTLNTVPGTTFIAP